MNLRKKVKYWSWDVGWPLSLGLLYAGITVAMNAGAAGLQAGFEYLQKAPKREYTATLKEKKVAPLLQTHGKLHYGIFELPNGQRLTVYDSPRVLEGKLFANEVLPEIEVGKNYKLSTIGTQRLGHTILSSQKVQEANN